jgi:Zn-dependent peptidase ImmA (M78 family)
MARRSVAIRSEVPFLHEKQIERDAECLLQEFAEKFYEVVEPPVPVDEIAELYLQLALEYKDMKSLFPFADVHGAIWFERGLIGIDKTLDPDVDPTRRGRYHFTLAHEMGHWRLHRQHYLKNPGERLLFEDGSQEPDVVCRSSERKKPVEWQADAFAARLLMPRKLVYAAWSEFRGGDGRSVELRELLAANSGVPLFYRGQPAATEEVRDIAVKEDFCRPLAERFEVSREAMRIRLEGLDLIVRERPKTLFE